MVKFQNFEHKYLNTFIALDMVLTDLQYFNFFVLQPVADTGDITLNVNGTHRVSRIIISQFLFKIINTGNQFD